MRTTIYLECPRCHGRIDFCAQLLDAVFEPREHLIRGSLVGSIWCEHCKYWTLVLTVEPMGDEPMVRLDAGTVDPEGKERV